MNAATGATRPPLGAILPALVLPLIAAWVYFVMLAGHDAAPAIYALSKALMVAWPVLVWLRWGPPPGLGDRSMSRGRIIGEGIAAGVVMGGTIMALALGPLSGLMHSAAPAIAAKVAEFGIATPGMFIIAAVALSVLHSAFEEWYWRWFGYGFLRDRLRPWLAHAMAGLAFALHHMVIAGVYAGCGAGIALGLVVGGAGVAWSLLYRRHCSIVGAWIAHGCCDATLMWLGWRVIGAG